MLHRYYIKVPREGDKVSRFLPQMQTPRLHVGKIHIWRGVPTYTQLLICRFVQTLSFRDIFDLQIPKETTRILSNGRICNPLDTIVLVLYFYLGYNMFDITKIIVALIGFR